MNYKAPKDIKIMFVLNILTFIVGFIVGNDVVIAASVIIAVILSVTIYILEAVYSIKN